MSFAEKYQRFRYEDHLPPHWDKWRAGELDTWLKSEIVKDCGPIPISLLERINTDICSRYLPKTGIEIDLAKANPKLLQRIAKATLDDILDASAGLKRDLIGWGQTAGNDTWVNWAQGLSTRALTFLFRLGFSENILLETLTEGPKMGEQHHLLKPTSPVLIVPNTARQVDEGNHRIGPSSN